MPRTNRQFSRGHRGFTLIEMLTTVAVLIIILGLMVSLARFVRDRSAQQLTRALLLQLDAMTRQYMDHNGGALPPVAELMPSSASPAAAAAGAGAAPSASSGAAGGVITLLPDESTLAEAARRNNEMFVRALRIDFRMHLGAPPAEASGHSVEPVEPDERDLAGNGSGAPNGAGLSDPFEQMPISVYDRRTIRDAWGSPLVFMPGQHPLIGMAPSRKGQDQSFFFSAGPDRKYLTRDDNLYSYESAPGAPE